MQFTFQFFVCKKNQSTGEFQKNCGPFSSLKPPIQSCILWPKTVRRKDSMNPVHSFFSYNWLHQLHKLSFRRRRFFTVPTTVGVDHIMLVLLTVFLIIKIISS